MTVQSKPPFVGTYERPLDYKTRFIMPAELVGIYRERGFRMLYQTAENGSVVFRDHIEKDFDKFYRAVPDKQNRVRIAEPVRAKVEFKPRDHVAIQGMGEFISVSRAKRGARA